MPIRQESTWCSKLSYNYTISTAIDPLGGCRGFERDQNDESGQTADWKIDTEAPAIVMAGQFPS